MSNQPGPGAKAQNQLPVWESLSQSGQRSGRLAASQLGMSMQHCRACCCRSDLTAIPTRVCVVQEKALKLTMLREVEPLVQKADSGSKGSVLEACCAAVEQHLSEEPYSQQVCMQYGTSGWCWSLA